jgi:4-carboxymuconolactone decarboxylase
MMRPAADPPDSPHLDAATRALVRLAGLIASGSEDQVRVALAGAAGMIDHVWVEELVLQSYLFAGFPRALNAARAWRRVGGGKPAAEAEPADDASIATWRARGEATCAIVYGEMYERLRHNIRSLHPDLDEWMIIEGYGKVLSRPGLDLERRELCIVAACLASRQERQLHSHLRGALNAGASVGEVAEALELLRDMVPPADLDRARHMFARVANTD